MFRNLNLNVSESYLKVDFEREYFIDQEKYYCVILLHMDIAIGIAAFALAATGALLLSCSKHISGMFKIAR